MTNISKVLLSVFVLLVIAWIVNVNYSGKKAKQTIVAYYIPSGYTGWVTIKYNIKDAPPIPFKPKGIGGTFKVALPESGILETSSPLYLQRHLTKYYRYDKQGERLFQNGAYNGLQSGKKIDKSWISSGTYNEDYLQFYVFKKPESVWKQPSEPATNESEKNR